MAAPKICECGRRIYVQPRKGRAGKWRLRPTSRGHDLCRTCFNLLKNPSRRPG